MLGSPDSAQGTSVPSGGRMSLPELPPVVKLEARKCWAAWPSFAESVPGRGWSGTQDSLALCYPSGPGMAAHLLLTTPPPSFFLMLEFFRLSFEPFLDFMVVLSKEEQKKNGPVPSKWTERPDNCFHLSHFLLLSLFLCYFFCCFWVH